MQQRLTSFSATVDDKTSHLRNTYRSVRKKPEATASSSSSLLKNERRAKRIKSGTENVSRDQRREDTIAERWRHRRRSSKTLASYEGEFSDMRPSE
ncbi:unnamed protein product [Lasius platythorax]|uniref:Uncharacterized protein n=1 Tax=Lasius platythorax TaxID=488582 RepID=A0AAV2NHQ5_9HYME